MAHRITRFLRSLFRRPVDPIGVYGIGMGSCGMLAKDARVTR
ncbi:hypothetical protein ACFWPQ_08425 [Streptomyces sp. NPDC058464]